MHPARLKLLKIGTARNFEKCVLTGRPDFDVVSLGRSKPQITGAKFEDSIMQTKQLQDSLGVRSERFQFVVRFFRRRDLHQLDFVELVHTDDPACLMPCCASLTAKTRSVGNK